jgi:hypothetical protein
MRQDRFQRMQVRVDIAQHCNFKHARLQILYPRNSGCFDFPRFVAVYGRPFPHTTVSLQAQNVDQFSLLTS